MMTRIAGVCLIALLSSLANVNAEQPGAEIAIIVHRSNPVDNLTRAELRQIFRLERQSWPSNKKITVVMRDSGQAERTQMLRALCSMSEVDFARHVLQATFRGDAASPPRTISTADGMRRFVFNVPGAIGYVRGNELDDTVKVIRVDGKLPGEPGYALGVSPGGDASPATQSR